MKLVRGGDVDSREFAALFDEAALDLDPRLYKLSARL